MIYHITIFLKCEFTSAHTPNCHARVNAQLYYNNVSYYEENNDFLSKNCNKKKQWWQTCTRFNNSLCRAITTLLLITNKSIIKLTLH